MFGIRVKNSFEILCLIMGFVIWDSLVLNILGCVGIYKKY